LTRVVVVIAAISRFVVCGKIVDESTDDRRQVQISQPCALTAKPY